VYIQYAGFELVSDSRTYNFRVIDPPEQTREFSVNLQDEAFRKPPFKTQDGPVICMARLRRELERETKESPACPSLRIAQGDIQEYVAKNYREPPRKWGMGLKS
jgi:hypothetical protein